MVAAKISLSSKRGALPWLCVAVLLPCGGGCARDVSEGRRDGAPPHDTLHSPDVGPDSTDGTVDATDANASADVCVGASCAPNPDLGRGWQTWTGTPHPEKSREAKLVYHATRGASLLYGGVIAGLGPSSKQMWQFKDSAWSQLCNPCLPGGRRGHGWVYDSRRGVAVLFGGTDDENRRGKLNDIWELDASGWQQVTPGGVAPSPRYGAYVAFDEHRGRMVVFGGVDAAGTYLDDVFEYDGTSWFGPMPKGSPWPTARYDEATNAAYVPANALAATLRERVVIYGGYNAPEGSPSDDMWAWDGAQWTGICASCSGEPRSVGALSYDGGSGRLVLVGGYNGNGEVVGTWEVDGLGWHLTTNEPSARDSAAIAYDPLINAIVLFGGNGQACSGDCDETLLYQPL